jgi:hypothetical protein
MRPGGWVETRVAEPKSCAGHRGASAANIVIKAETREDFDTNIFMAARFRQPQTPSYGAGEALSSREEYTRKFTRIHG